MAGVIYSYYCRGYDESMDVFRAYLCKDALSVPDGKDIVIKINMCDLRPPETGSVTHPVFLKSFILHLKDLYPKKTIYIAEADATVVFAREFYSWLGYERALAGLDVPFINLSEEPCEEKTINGFVFRSLPLPIILRENFFITMAKLKTNVTSLITASLKNQYVFVPGLVKSQYHSNVDKAIADCNLLRKPDFCIVDGIIGQGGPKGPSFGTPINSHCIVWGIDPVAIDTYSSRLMGIPPAFVRHIHYCQKSGLGTTQFRLEGDFRETRINFETSIVSLVFFRLAGKMQRAIQLRVRKKR